VDEVENKEINNPQFIGIWAEKGLLGGATLT
jgi:hypothetical protein